MCSSVYPLCREEQKLAAPVQRVHPQPPRPRLRAARSSLDVPSRESPDQLLRVPPHGLRLQSPHRGRQRLRRHLPREVPLVPQERGVERPHGSHILRKGSGRELEEEAEAAEDPAADLGGDFGGRYEPDESGGHPWEVREEGALEVACEDR